VYTAAEVTGEKEHKLVMSLLDTEHKSTNFEQDLKKGKEYMMVDNELYVAFAKKIKVVRDKQGAEQHAKKVSKLDNLVFLNTLRSEMLFLKPEN